MVFLGLFLSATFVSAWTATNVGNANVFRNRNVNISNGTEWFSYDPWALGINVTTNATGAGDNVSVFYDGATANSNATHFNGYWLSNATIGNWTNRTRISLNASGLPDVTRILAIRVNDSDGSTWTNLTYIINEFPVGGITFTAQGKFINGGEYFTADIPINITTNRTASSCVWTNSTGGSNAFNNESVRTNWVNSTRTPMIGEANGGALRYLYFACDDGWGNRTWSNATSSFTFTINERAPGNLTLSGSGITNNTNHSSTPAFSISTSATMTNCTALVNRTTTVSMPNATGVRTAFANSSETIMGGNTPFQRFDNATYYCSDFWGNTTWFNTTNVSGFIEFRMDTINPTAHNIAYGTINGTSGNMLTVAFNQTDNSHDSPYVNIYHPDNTRTTSSGATLMSLLRVSSNYSINLTGSDISKDGLYRFETVGKDLFRTNNSGVNSSIYVATQAKSSQWVPMSVYGNLTLSDIASLMPNVTYVSIYDNRAGWKNFTTFQVGLSTNANTIVNSTFNTTLVYTNANNTLLRAWNTTVETRNQTLQTGGWNLVTPLGERTLNATMYLNIYTNYTNANGAKTVTNSANITYVSFYNSTTGKFCTARRGFSITSCDGFNVTQITVRSGYGLWMLTNDNATFRSDAL